MPLAFRHLGADFSGLCSTDEPLALSSVAQQVRITVDEAGTEAVAVTAIRSSRGLGNPATREFKADRPFVFFLRDLRTGSILFLGRLTDPGTSPRGKSRFAENPVAPHSTRSVLDHPGDPPPCSQSSGPVPGLLRH